MPFPETFFHFFFYFLESPGKARYGFVARRGVTPPVVFLAGHPPPPFTPRQASTEHLQRWPGGVGDQLRAGFFKSLQLQLNSAAAELQTKPSWVPGRSGVPPPGCDGAGVPPPARPCSLPFGGGVACILGRGPGWRSEAGCASRAKDGDRPIPLPARSLIPFSESARALCFRTRGCAALARVAESR